MCKSIYFFLIAGAWGDKVINMPGEITWRSVLFVCHDVENHVIGLVHTVFAQAAEIVNAAVEVAFAETVGGVDDAAVAGEFGAHESGGEDSNFRPHAYQACALTG